MQPRHTEPGTMYRPAAPSKARNMTSTTPEKPSTPKPMAEKPKVQKEKSNEKTIEFQLRMSQARTVAVVGTFNDWDAKRTPMQKDSSGSWKTSMALAPGRYEYRFVADGQWLSDPNAKESVGNDFGSTNSVLIV